MNGKLATSERMLFVLIACALGCIAIAILCGAISALFYFPGAAAFLNAIGVKFQNLRPLHTTFASAWIFLGGLACVQKYLADQFGEPTAGDRRRFRFQMVCFGAAGLGIFFSTLFGWGSGREYLGFNPVFSLPILAGWLAFTWTFFAKVIDGFWARPVYVYMWGTGLLFFLYTFIEGHAWLLPGVRHYPIADLQIQWKSCGTLVASFNMLVYGTLMYVGERVSGDGRYARSSKGFALMGVGMLNSFTNYAHHTYHLPQSEVIKWVAFVVSMLEIIILVSVFNDVRRAMADKSPVERFDPTLGFVSLARGWTFGLLLLAILISIPPANSFIHGTRVVMAHAMGSEIGIDSFVLFAFVAWIFDTTFARCWATQEKMSGDSMRRRLIWLNLSLIALFAWLMINGLTVGITRALSRPPPEWITKIGPTLFVTLGLLHGSMLLHVLAHWSRLLIRPSERRARELDRIPIHVA